MWRGVGVFLVFVLLLTGWGLFFYQRSVTRLYEEYLIDEKTLSKVKTHAGIQRKKRETQKESFGSGDKGVSSKESSSDQVALREEKVKKLLAEKEELTQKYSQLLSRIERIEKVYQEISKENEELRERLKEKEKTIALLGQKLSQAVQSKQELEVKLQSLMGEVDSVRLENKVLKAKINELNEVLNSMDKLKQAMRNLRMKIYFERKKRRKEKEQVVGNRGYVILNGRPTLGKEATLSVEVIPVFD